MKQHKHLATAAICCAVAAISADVHARAGTHAAPVSTWDTRASTVVGAFRYGFVDGGQTMQASYYANFTSTSGNLSAQFGLHYVNYQDPLPDDRTGMKPLLAHGMSGTAIALLSVPVAERYENGIPKAAFAFYAGGAPTALVAGEFNFITIPLTLGLGVPWTPHPAITFAPWYEMAPSVNLDSQFIPIEDPSSLVGLIDTSDPNNPTITLGPEQIAQILAQGVELTVGARINMRAGLHTAVHLSQAVDLNLTADVGSFDSAFTGPLVVGLGAALVFRWDDVVPAVLPPSKRLESVDCESVKYRYNQCYGDPSAPNKTPVPPAPVAAPVPVTSSPAAPPATYAEPAPVSEPVPVSEPAASPEPAPVVEDPPPVEPGPPTQSFPAPPEP